MNWEISCLCSPNTVPLHFGSRCFPATSLVLDIQPGYISLLCSVSFLECACLVKGSIPSAGTTDHDHCPHSCPETRSIIHLYTRKEFAALPQLTYILCITILLFQPSLQGRALKCSALSLTLSSFPSGPTVVSSYPA